VSVGCNLFYSDPTLLTAQGAADVTCAAGASTTALSVGGAGTALSQSNPDSVIPTVFGVLVIVLGATAPSALVIAYCETTHTAIDSYTVLAALLVNSATLVVPISFVGSASRSSYAGSGASPLITVSPTGQAVTVKNGASRAVWQLAVATD